MAPSPQHIAQLLHQYLGETLDEQAQVELNAWLDASPIHPRFLAELEDDGMIGKLIVRAQADDEEDTGNVLMQRAKSQLTFARPAAVHQAGWLRRWGWAAACAILLCGAGAYIWTAGRKDTPVQTHQADIAPGKNGAVLTLGDGTQITLDSLNKGIVATQNGVRVLLQENGLVYQPAGSTVAGIMYNTITTPRGRQFHIVLPDGTRAWLNAASAITYPTVFTGSERSVKITGEVFLEVSQDAKMPFHVNVDDRAEVAVLGTAFNVNAYRNETSIHATLLEGSIRINKATAAALLKPGQQALIVNTPVDARPQPGIRVIDQADIGKAIAWKNGVFNFEGMELTAIMRQIERWYDIQVRYEGPIPVIKFKGEIDREISLSGIIRMLNGPGIHTRLEGRTLVISGQK